MPERSFERDGEDADAFDVWAAQCGGTGLDRNAEATRGHQRTLDEPSSLADAEDWGAGEEWSDWIEALG